VRDIPRGEAGARAVNALRLPDFFGSDFFKVCIALSSVANFALLSFREAIEGLSVMGKEESDDSSVANTRSRAGSTIWGKDEGNVSLATFSEILFSGEVAIPETAATVN
jgi:hypothetical protein